MITLRELITYRIESEPTKNLELVERLNTLRAIQENNVEKGVREMRKSGKIKWFSYLKRYGFIEGDNGEQHFVHVTDILKSLDDLLKGLPVSYEIGQWNGRPTAIRIELEPLKTKGGTNEPICADQKTEQ